MEKLLSAYGLPIGIVLFLIFAGIGWYQKLGDLAVAYLVAAGLTLFYFQILPSRVREQWGEKVVSGKSDKWGFALISIVILIFMAVVYSFATHLPFFDDFYSSVPLALKIKNAETFSQVMAQLFGRAMEHYVVGYNLLCVLSYELTGHYSATAQRLMGVVLLVLFVTVLFLSTKRRPGRAFLFAPVAFLVVQFQYHQIILWPSNFAGSFLFATLVVSSFVLLSFPSRTAFLGSLATGVLAVFSFGNGFLVLLLGLVRLLYARQYKRSLIWLLVTTLSLGWFFGQLYSPGSTRNISLYFQFLFSFFGSAFTLGFFPIIPVL